MWDGWAVVRFKDGTEEILVVEAKANSSEFETPGTSEEPPSAPKSSGDPPPVQCIHLHYSH